MIETHFQGNSISTNSAEAFSLQRKSSFGEIIEGKVNYSLVEAFFLFEKKKIEVLFKNKALSKEELLKKLNKIDKRFDLRYPVFKDLREKGYILKTALKFGADFRVYGKGEKPGNSHSKWILFTDYESNKNHWQDFAAKNRVAHSTKKKLILAILDEEGKISYYEVSWIKP